MAERKSFLVYRDWEDSFSTLSNEQMGALSFAMFAYVNRGQPYDGGDPAVAMAFSFVRAAFDRDAEKYRKRCEQNSKNAKKRSQNPGEADSEKMGAAEGSQPVSKEADAAECSQTVPEEANASERCRTQANEADIDKDKDKDIDRDRDKDKDKNAFLAAASPIPAESEAAAEQKEEFGWLADRCRSVTGISPNAAQRETLENWCQTCGSEAVERLFDEARAHNGKTFGYLAAIMRRWEKTGVPGGQAQNRPRRGPEPRSAPTPEEAARQQAALEDNRRQLEQLLADTDWMEDGRGA
ncbi:MAG: DnaD domain protein [Oscillospiraceae bacterium]|nr:DnaD domain protein [Oscillospiraceae bacterium]